MAVKNIRMLLYNNAGGCLLMALFLTISSLSICGANLTETDKISRDDNKTRPETTITQGTVRGINMVTHHNRTVSGFIGIPYAQPPVGGLRFKSPAPAGKWSGIFDASSDSELCPQMNNGTVVGDEDCLYLNVFTPQLPTSDNSTLLPVMVYVIGGGFRTLVQSTERFGPDFLLDEDIVLVIPSFRIGVLGFLSTGDEAAPGNYGLKDIVQALQWVQDNIRYFGGDANQVTFFGGSSGAMSVHLLALSNLTDGLIHRYITQSASALSNKANQPREACANRAFKLGAHLHCPTSTSTLLIDCLRDLDVSQLVDTDSLFHVWAPYPTTVWLPTTEPDIEGALLTDTPANLYAAGKIRDLPWIAGVNRDEGLVSVMKFYRDQNLMGEFLKNIDLILPYMLNYYETVDDVETYTAALKSYYLNDLTADRSILLTNLTDLWSDSQFVYSVYTAVQQHQLFAQSPHYFYSFQYRGTFSHGYSSGGSNEYRGVSHGDELMYLFGRQEDRFGPPNAEYNEFDWVMVDTMVQLWTSFAINGTPTTSDSISTTTWEPYSKLNNYLRIGNESDTDIEMEYDLLLERMQFWDKLTKATTTSGAFQNPFYLLPITLCLDLLSYIL